MSNPYASPTNTNSNGWSVSCADTPENVAQRIAHFFEGQGYRLESGTTTNGMYGIGSNVMRILFGAFVKRYLFQVVVQQAGPNSVVYVEKGMSGVMGGAIGYSKMKTELSRIRTEIQNLLGSAQQPNIGH